MKTCVRAIALLLLGWLVPLAWAGAADVRIAAASDLRPAMEAIAVEFRALNPHAVLRVSYGSSGKFATQLRHGAPFDLYFSADERYPAMLAAEGLGSAPQRYARGRLVLWMRGEGPPPELVELLGPRVRRIAIANPEHAPYGERAMDVLRASGLDEALRSRLVLAENAGQSLHFVHSGAAEAGLLAYSLVRHAGARGGRYQLIDEQLHAPLWQAAMLSRRGAGNPDAVQLLDFVLGERGRVLLAEAGFELP
jgi:molybdate transport system substrate-binding protein